MQSGQVCLGTVTASTDASLSEALASVLDFIWVDAEHGALSLETVLAHAIAVKAAGKPLLVRVGWNDPVLIKPVLDLGADGVIVPLIRTADDARRAVAACKYPPEGVRGYGPRRANNYGNDGGGPEYCKKANDSIFIVVQIEHMDAVKNLDDILAVPGLTSILIGSNDLAGSMGHIGEPRHPEVLPVIESVIAKARKTDVFVGMGIGDDADAAAGWIAQGVQWMSLGNEFSLMLRGTRDVVDKLRKRRSHT